MDYETYLASREEIRVYANMFRIIFNLSPDGVVDPLSLLDKMVDIYGNASYEVIEDKNLPQNIPARCIVSDDDKFIIQISEKIFNGAYERNVGGYRMHILHEIVHIFADKIGFKPIHNRAYRNNRIEPCRSLEWVVKAMTGEIMMPYEATIGLSEDELIARYGVSPSAAQFRQTY